MIRYRGEESRLKGRSKKKITIEKDAAFFIYLGYGALFSLFCLYFLLQKDLPSAAISLLFLFILLMLAPITRLLRLKAPPVFLFLLLFLCLGSLLGSCFNFYFRIPFWDILLHVLAGWTFAAAGYAICTLLFPYREKSSALPYLIFGIAFSLSIGLLWELFEAGTTLLLPVDMQEDALVFSLKSFYLSGTHDFVTEISGITETLIRYGNGKTLRLAGYLDLGLWDTLCDMAVCLLGNLLFLLLFPMDRLFGGRLLSHLLPQKNKGA